MNVILGKNIYTINIITTCDFKRDCLFTGEHNDRLLFHIHVLCYDITSCAIYSRPTAMFQGKAAQVECIKRHIITIEMPVYDLRSWLPLRVTSHFSHDVKNPRNRWYQRNVHVLNHWLFVGEYAGNTFPWRDTIMTIDWKMKYITHRKVSKTVCKRLCHTLYSGPWCCSVMLHDDVIKWKHLPRYWPFVRGIHRSPVNSPHKGQLRGALMFTLICARINGWVNNGEAGDLRRNRAHYDVIVMMLCGICLHCVDHVRGHWLKRRMKSLLGNR